MAKTLSAFSCFPRRLALKFEGQVISAAASINLIQTNIVALYRPSKAMFQMIRGTRVQKVAVFEHFVLRCGVKLCIQSLTGCANHSTRISNPTLRLAIPVRRCDCFLGGPKPGTNRPIQCSGLRSCALAVFETPTNYRHSHRVPRLSPPMIM